MSASKNNSLIEPTPVSNPWYGNPPPYPLSHCRLALNTIFAIIFTIFETFLEIIEPGFGNQDRFWWVRIQVGALVALTPKFFLPGWKLAQRGDWTTSVHYPWHAKQPPYPLTHCRLTVSTIFAIIFCIFETFLEIIETGFRNLDIFWWVRIQVGALVALIAKVFLHGRKLA